MTKQHEERLSVDEKSLLQPQQQIRTTCMETCATL